MWLVVLSDQLQIVGLVSLYPTNYLICHEVWNNLLKGELMPDVKIGRHLLIFKVGDRKA